MGLDKAFVPATAAGRRPRPKIALGGKKPGAGSGDQGTGASRAQAPDLDIPAGVPMATAVQTSSGTDQPLVRAYTKRGTEKASDAEIEEIPNPKRQRPGSPDQTPLVNALLGGGDRPATLLARIAATQPASVNTGDLTLNQVAEQGARDLIQAASLFADVFTRAKPAEVTYLTEAESLKRTLARKEAKLQEAEKKLQSAELRAIEAEKKAEEAVAAYKASPALYADAATSLDRLAGFLCRTPDSAEAFFRSWLKHPAGEDLVWRFGKWAFASGQRAMQNEVRIALEESLEGDDLTAVLGVLPDEVAEPGPNPYADPPAPAQSAGEKSPPLDGA